MLQLPATSSALLLALLASIAAAQSPVFVLRPAAATLDHEFTRVGSVRELGDGRILVTETEEDVLLVADLHTGTCLLYTSDAADEL